MPRAGACWCTCKPGVDRHQEPGCRTTEVLECADCLSVCSFCHAKCLAEGSGHQPGMVMQLAASSTPAATACQCCLPAVHVSFHWSTQPQPQDGAGAAALGVRQGQRICGHSR